MTEQQQPKWMGDFDTTFPTVGDDSFRIIVPEMIGRQPTTPLLMYFIKAFIARTLEAELKKRDEEWANNIINLGATSDSRLDEIYAVVARMTR